MTLHAPILSSIAWQRAIAGTDIDLEAFGCTGRIVSILFRARGLTLRALVACFTPPLRYRLTAGCAHCTVRCALQESVVATPDPDQILALLLARLDDFAFCVEASDESVGGAC